MVMLGAKWSYVRHSHPVATSNTVTCSHFRQFFFLQDRSGSQPSTCLGSQEGTCLGSRSMSWLLTSLGSQQGACLGSHQGTCLGWLSTGMSRKMSWLSTRNTSWLSTLNFKRARLEQTRGTERSAVRQSGPGTLQRNHCLGKT